MEHLAELNPKWRFVFEEAPPLGKKILMRTLHGGAIIGDYYPQCDAVAWSYLPTYSPTQRRLLDAIISAGFDPTKHRSKQYENLKGEDISRLTLGCNSVPRSGVQRQEDMFATQGDQEPNDGVFLPMDPDDKDAA